jgi:BioD-like phosphotransacetylase family protein
MQKQELKILIAEGKKKNQAYQRIIEERKAKASRENDLVPKGWYLEDGKPRNKDVESILSLPDEIASALESSRQGLTKEEWDEGVESASQAYEKIMSIISSKDQKE